MLDHPEERERYSKDDTLNVMHMHLDCVLVKTLNDFAIKLIEYTPHKFIVALQTCNLSVPTYLSHPCPPYFDSSTSAQAG